MDRTAYRFLGVLSVSLGILVLLIAGAFKSSSTSKSKTKFVHNREQSNHDLLKRDVVTTDVAISPRIYSPVYIRKQGQDNRSSSEGNKDITEQTEDVAECRDFHEIPNLTDVCGFILNTSDCDIDEGFLNYSRLVYCKFPHLVPLAVGILFLWWLFMFAGLATTADSYFCPSLTVISKTLRLSQNIAGVTFLAFGNGAPDIFSAISAIGNANGGDAGLAIGALLGAGIFVTTVVAGSIAITNPFVAMERPLLRDIIFYLGAVFWTFSVLYHKEIRTAEALGFIALYVVYVIVVVVSRAIYQAMKRKHEKEEKKKSDEESFPPNTPELSIQVTHDNTIAILPDDLTHVPSVFVRHPSPEDDIIPSISRLPTIPSPVPKKGSAVKGLARMAETIGVTSTFGSEAFTNATLLPQDRWPSLMDASQEELESLYGATESTSLLTSTEKKKPRHIILGFLKAVCPVDLENFRSWNLFWKIFEIFKCPIVLALNLTIPVVDYDEDLHKWNKPLNSLNCLLAPLYCVFATQAAMKTIGGVLPVWSIALMVGVALSILVYATSSHTQPPKYHWVFAYGGFVVAVIWIYSIANEIVNLLQAFGVVFNMSNAVLGLTLLAWGNSIGDLIADIATARQGFPRMAISACFGGPLFNILLGIGLPFSIATLKNDGVFEIHFTFIQVILAGFLALSLLSTLIVIPLRKFHFTRGYGIYLMLLYVSFLVVALLTETGVIHVEL